MKIIVCKVSLLLTMCLIFLRAAHAQERVFKMEIKATIDPRSSRYVRMALEEAVETEADYVLIEMDTYGGAVDDADKIRTNILDFEKPIFVFINKNAASAGALISIACDSIYMNEGANIGAATVVNGLDGAKAPDKYQSYFRSIMRSTAEAKGRNTQIAQAMVDENLEVEGVSIKGQVITFTTSEAIKNDFCEGKVSSVEDILNLNGIEDYELIEYNISQTEKIITWFLNPVVSSVLILVILGGIYFELQTPGVGFPLVAAIVAALLYFVPYYLNGLAENWEIIMFVIGILFISAEVFVIPGFGVVGIIGIMLTFSSFTLVMLNNDWFDFSQVQMPDFTKALSVSFGGGFGAVILVLLGLSRLSQSKILAKIALTETLDKRAGYVSDFRQEDLTGMQGIAHTVLRPSGKVMINNEIYDATTRGEYLDKGEDIVVSSYKGSIMRVKKQPPIS